VDDLWPLVIAAAVAVAVTPLVLRGLPTRSNYRSREVAFPAGAAALAASFIAIGLMALLDHLAGTELVRHDVIEGAYFNRSVGSDAVVVATGLGVGAAATLALGVAFLGLLDDLLDAPARGWKGHLGALREGELSTGMLKAGGTAALAGFVLLGEPRWLLAVPLIALTTNLFNLLDLRPGRAWKGFVVVAVALVIAGHTEELRAIGPWIGPLLVVGLYDLRERAMLGDTGANVLGAMAGLWLVLALDATGEWIALAVVLALNVYGELRSISAAVERTAPLRFLDGLGRPK
jgi:UDP-N-acetylmuramyl pentapeptide phosphotransferase/UDP-N-acetylglucosamine-1-phosphate transferase